MAGRAFAASVSVATNAFLIVVKFTVGFITGSLAIQADALHSFLDLIGSLAAYLGIRAADKPPDREHAYGHEKFENVSALIQTVLIAVIGLLVILEAVRRVLFGSTVDVTVPSILVMALTIPMSLAMSKYLFKESEKHQSAALEADAYHFSMDMLSGGAVITGLIFVLYGFGSADIIAAAGVALIMLRTSATIGKRSVEILIDSIPSQEVLTEMERTVLGVCGVRGIHSLRARKAGSSILVDMCVHVDPESSVREAHEVAHAVEEEIKKRIRGVKEVIVHAEPGDHRPELEKAHA